MTVTRIATFGTSLTRGGGTGGYQDTLRTLLAAGNYLPGATYQTTTRSIGGATSTRLLRNVARPIADDPSVVIIECFMNDAVKSQVASLQTRANLQAIIRHIRAGIANVRVVVMTTNNVRLAKLASNVSIPDLDKYYDVARYLTYSGSESVTDKPDVLFDGTCFWRNVADTFFVDGIHPSQIAWNKYITPRLSTFLGPWLTYWEANGMLRHPVSAQPSAIWTPLL